MHDWLRLLKEDNHHYANICIDSEPLDKFIGDGSTSDRPRIYIDVDDANDGVGADGRVNEPGPDQGGTTRDISDDECIHVVEAYVTISQCY